MLAQFNGLIWFVLTLLPLVFLQRLLHREIQAVFLILSRSERFTVTIFSLIFLPGVLLHELSHYGMAVLLGIETARFSLIPQVLDDGRLQLGFVETAKSDIVRDSLVGAAPLIVGGGFVAFMALVPLHLQPMWAVLRNGQLGLFWFGITGLFTIHDFPFLVLHHVRGEQYDAALAIGSSCLASARCDHRRSDRAGDSGWHRSVDADLSCAAIECLSQRGGDHIWIERGSAYCDDIANDANPFLAFEVDWGRCPIRGCACTGEIP